MVEDSDIPMLWLLHVSGLSVSSAVNALRELGSAEAVWNAGRRELSAARGLTARDTDKLQSAGRDAGIKSLTALMGVSDMSFVSIENAAYPALLKFIANAPPGLFYRGRLPDKDALSIAIIGSRDCTDYGRAVSYRLARDLAERGVTIVSGMARGADGAAHQGALDAGGYTAAVAGTGLDECFPKENIPLYRRILETGCAISELPPRTKYQKAHFPMRNRLISGLCHGLILTESGFRSGTSITVDCALDQGRQVFAVPGGIFSELSAGPNRLIRDGAVPVTCCEDVLEEFGRETGMEILDKRETRRDNNRQTANNNEIKASEPVPEPEERFSLTYSHVNETPVSLEELAQKTGMDIQKLLFNISMLELDGFIRILPGGRYIRKDIGG